jgi:hypothetical protein
MCRPSWQQLPGQQGQPCVLGGEGKRAMSWRYLRARDWHKSGDPVIRERIGWHWWRAVRNLATGAVRYERCGPFALEREHGATRLEIGRLWFVRCAPERPNAPGYSNAVPSHPNAWMIAWRRKREAAAVYAGNANYPIPWMRLKDGILAPAPAVADNVPRIISYREVSGDTEVIVRRWGTPSWY